MRFGTQRAEGREAGIEKKEGDGIPEEKTTD
jgi:hypothetical protein